jgi:hypothetical protein
VLVRLDFGGSPHGNPDGKQVASPHLHVYREDYGDKWAFSLPPGFAPENASIWDLLEGFMNYCKITVKPNINRGLFT